MINFAVPPGTKLLARQGDGIKTRTDHKRKLRNVRAIFRGSQMCALASKEVNRNQICHCLRNHGRGEMTLSQSESTNHKV